jgi:hypothetical protein
MVRGIVINRDKQNDIAGLDLPLLLMKFQNAIDRGVLPVNDDGSNVQLLEYLISDLELAEANRTQWAEEKYAGITGKDINILANSIDTILGDLIDYLDRSIQEAVNKHVGGTIRQNSIVKLRKSVTNGVGGDMSTIFDAQFKILATNMTARDRTMRVKLVQARARCKENFTALAKKYRSEATASNVA